VHILRRPVKKKRALLVALVLLLVHCASPASADEVILKDGSRVIGKVRSKKDNTLEFKTSFAGTINIKWNKVVELKTDKPQKVLLTNHELIPARVLRNTEATTTVESEPGAAPQEYEKSQVAFINPESWRMGKGFRFTGNVNAAMQIERGNTDKGELDFDGQATLRRLNNRLRFWGEAEIDRSEGEIIKRKWKANSEYNYFFANKWFMGVVLGFEHDKFADLDLRTKIGPLIGYQFFESDYELNLSLSLGPIRVIENYDQAENNRYWAAGWQLNFDKYLITDRLQFYHNQSGLWNQSNTSDLVWNTWTGLRFPLFAGIVASGEVKVETNLGAVEGTDKLDHTYRAKLGYQW